MKQVFIIYILGCWLLSCKTRDCNKLPTNFDTYADAVSTIKKTSFSYKDEANTSNSSWIKAATYYSCDSNTGYMTIKTKDREYVYEGVSADEWKQFKAAESLGTYYNRHIKGHYHMNAEKQVLITTNDTPRI